MSQRQRRRLTACWLAFVTFADLIPRELGGQKQLFRGPPITAKPGPPLLFLTVRRQWFEGPVMESLRGHLICLFGRQLETEGFISTALMFAGIARAMIFHKMHRELLQLEIFEKYIGGVQDTDVLFHLSHRHYLSNTFNHRERIECALTHYRFEGERYDSRYKDAVYRDGGVILWSRTADEVNYVLKLVATTALRHEGGISIVLCAGEVVLSEMSYAWVPATVLGLGGGTVPFITRNQSVRRNSMALLRFRSDFPQNSPSYFCLAALHGIAQANGYRRIAAIRHDCQVAFDERYVTGFRNSYCELWKSFDATELGLVAHVMAVPLATPPLSTVKAKHRKRAMDRRRHWSEIARTAQQVLAPHLRATDTDEAPTTPPCPGFVSAEVPVTM